MTATFPALGYDGRVRSNLIWQRRRPWTRNRADWLMLAVGIPLILFWLTVVAGLSLSASRGECSRSMHWISLSNLMVCGVVSAAYCLLNVWHPIGFEDWMNHFLFLFVFVCFMVALGCRIWRTNPPKSKEERRLMLVMGAALGILNFAIILASLLVTEWYNVLFLIPYGILLALACISYHKAQARIQRQA